MPGTCILPPVPARYGLPSFVPAVREADWSAKRRPFALQAFAGRGRRRVYRKGAKRASNGAKHGARPGSDAPASLIAGHRGFGIVRDDRGSEHGLSRRAVEDLSCKLLPPCDAANRRPAPQGN